MKFTFTDKKVNLPNKVHAYAEKKVGKLDRYFKADAEAAIVFSVEKDRNNVELTVRSGSVRPCRSAAVLRERRPRSAIRPAEPGSYSGIVPRSGSIPLPSVGAQLRCANSAAGARFARHSRAPTQRHYPALRERLSLP